MSNLVIKEGSGKISDISSFWEVLSAVFIGTFGREASERTVKIKNEVLSNKHYRETLVEKLNSLKKDGEIVINEVGSKIEFTTLVENSTTENSTEQQNL